MEMMYVFAVGQAQGDCLWETQEDDWENKGNCTVSNVEETE